MQAFEARVVLAEMQRGGNDRDGDQSEAGDAGDGGQVEETAAHQWNICAEPGW